MGTLGGAGIGLGRHLVAQGSGHQRAKRLTGGDGRGKRG
jgi:hypothetical protein